MGTEVLHDSEHGFIAFDAVTPGLWYGFFISASLLLVDFGASGLKQPHPKEAVG
jgi:hypothetical protein